VSAPANDVRRAQAEAEAARSKLMGTVHELQARLQPKVLAHDAATRLKERGTAFADDTMEAARERPGVVGAAAGAVVVFLLRRRIGRLAGRLFLKRDETAGARAG